jgi:cobalt-zinc-cadmium efflux system membrane fusion protein
VTLGRRDGPMVGIAAGLAGTETIATGNSFTLKAELRKGDAGHED